MAAVHHLLLTLLLTFHQVQYISAEVQTWYKVQVSDATLDAETPLDERNVRSETQCVMMASKDPQNQLTCLRTPDVCTTYDIYVLALKSNSSSSAATPCWTKHHFSDLPEGSGVVHDDCSLSTVVQGSLQPYRGDSGERTPFISFLSLVDKNCIVLGMTKTNWHEARPQCQSVGGDLFVAGDLAGMIEYVGQKVTQTGHVIIGATNTGGNHLWLDGRPINSSELDHDQPPIAGQCFYVAFLDLLHTHGCSRSEYVLCQKGVQYP